MKKKLALHGGEKAIARPFSIYHSHGAEEKRAAIEVIESGSLSRFFGSWCEDFFGGEKVQAFERAWEKAFRCKHAVTMNSATSGLIAAVGAIGVEPGDEVIVSPWTMGATATSIVVWNAIPVFADIDPDTFNLDVNSIRRNITPRTKAIVVPDIFGHPAELDSIMAIAREHGLKVIEDAAQAPGALYKGRFAGTVADIGVFSLNYHKHIHTGEGGVCVTDNAELAERLQLIRNHGEVVVRDKGTKDISNIIGFNFRLGEIEAAMGIEQLKKLDRFVEQRQRAAARLSRSLSEFNGLKVPVVKPDCTHVYYVYPLTLDVKTLGVSRQKIVEALDAEGVPSLISGYQSLHLAPMYQQKIAYGKKGFPWAGGVYQGNVSYAKGICPVAETLHDSTLMGLQACAHDFNDEEVDLTIVAFQKVWDNLESLR